MKTLRAYEYVAVLGYPFPELQPLTPGAYVDARLLSEDRLRMWVAYGSDEPVAVGALFTEAGLAQLALGVSLPSVRGRGFWSARVRDRITAAAGLPVVAVCSDMSRRGLEAMGFLPLFRLTLWLHPAYDRDSFTSHSRGAWGSRRWRTSCLHCGSCASRVVGHQGRAKCAPRPLRHATVGTASLA